ncbi:hypothetical protein MKX01_029037 [Papaver californicum]|nr:hypothetical protein MKX01_029037 [Papaver californicum]
MASSCFNGSSISSAYHHERRPYIKPKSIQSQSISKQTDQSSSSTASSLTAITTTWTTVNNNNNLAEKNNNSRNVRGERDRDREKERESRERKEEVNNKIASKKAISVILRREATKAIIEKKKGPTNSNKLLPRTVLEDLHERISALRWESALKQPEKARELFQFMIDEGCMANHESYTALVSAYSRTGLLDQAFSLLEQMKVTPGFFAFHRVQTLLSDMAEQGVKPSTITYNTLIDAYGRAGRFGEMESTLMEMLQEQECQPDVWTMNSTLRAFGGTGQIETMERCYEKFQSACILMEYMQKYYFSWTIVTYNVVIDAFGRAGDLKQMEYLFRLMRSERIKPNWSGAKEKIEGVLRFIEDSDILLDTVFFNCLVDAYGRLVCLAGMRQVLEMMGNCGCKPDKVTYSTMIKAYTSNGVSSRAK